MIWLCIIDARQAKGLSQKELAEITGIKQPAIGHISPSVDTMQAQKSVRYIPRCLSLIAKI